VTALRFIGAALAALRFIGAALAYVVLIGTVALVIAGVASGYGL
jgi:hypothetical protein